MRTIFMRIQQRNMLYYSKGMSGSAEQEEREGEK